MTIGFLYNNAAKGTIMEKLLIMIGAAASGFAALADGETWQSRSPLQDTFVNYTARDTASGDNAGIIVGNGREGCMMFDVSGLGNVTVAKIKLYISRCGTTEGTVSPSSVAVAFKRGETI